MSVPLLPRPLRKYFKGAGSTPENELKSKLPEEFAKGDSDLLASDAAPGGGGIVPSLDDSSHHGGFVAFYNNGSYTPSCIEDALVANSAVTVVPGPPSSAVVEFKFARDKIICIRDTGIVDLIKYGMSESSKVALNQYSKQHPPGSQVRRANSLRGSVTQANTTGGVSTVPAGALGDIISFDSLDANAAPIVSADREPEISRKCRDVLCPNFHSNVDLCLVRPYLSWSTRDKIVVIAESIIGGVLAIPRLPVVTLRSGGYISPPLAHGQGSDPVQVGNSLRFKCANLTHFVRLDSLVLTAGRTDGVISIRELDPQSGAQLSGGDFKAHRFAVTYLSSDSIPGAHFSMIASCDIAGQVLVWMVSQSQASNSAAMRYVASRRPQRIFRCFPGEFNCCDISLQMGVVVVGSGGGISVFSIERNERFRYIDVAADLLYLLGKRLEAQKNGIEVNSLLDADDYPTAKITGEVHNNSYARGSRLWSDYSKCVIKCICTSDLGGIIVYAEISSQESPKSAYATPTKSGNSEPSDLSRILVSYSISGTRTGFHELSSSVSCLSCPNRSAIVIAGTDDGSILFLQGSTLELLHCVRPHENCVRLTSSGEIIASGGRAYAPDSAARGIGANQVPVSAIVRIRVGPNADRPILAVASNANGQLFLIPFPDYIKYEKAHSTSTLSQIVNAPIQAVKGTLQQAQNLTILAGDAAGSLAQNAKGLADDAIGEAQNFLKKVTR
jgi:hypothetical protein